MNSDIVPELLDEIQKDFAKQYKANKRVVRIRGLLKSKEATYKEANEFAVECGEMLANSFSKFITPDSLPEGRLWYNIASRVLEPTLHKNYSLITDITNQVQTAFNEKNGVGFNPVTPAFDTNRLNGLVDKVSNAENYENVQWVLGEPVVNFSQAVVDDAIRDNAQFHYKAGLQPKIVRTLDSHETRQTKVGKRIVKYTVPCRWCQNLAGEYEYPYVPSDVYRRHDKCRCTLEYISDGNRKVLWKKQYEDDPQIKAEKQERIELNNARKQQKDELAELKQNTSKLRTVMTPAEYQEYLKLIDENENGDVKAIYNRYADGINSLNYVPTEGYYKPSLNSITFSYTAEDRIANGMSKYSTLAHEYGHYFDSKAKYTGLSFNEIDTIKGSGNFWLESLIKKKASSSDQFLKAVRQDKELIRSILNSETVAKIKSTDATGGVQDAIQGMYPKLHDRLRLKWGHEKGYYNRTYNNIKKLDAQKQLQQIYKSLGMDASNQDKVEAICRDYETASEMWANIMSAITCGGDELTATKEYLPNSYEALIEIMKGIEK